MAKVKKKKRGRPAKPVAERRRNNLTIRMRDVLRKGLSKSAVNNQRSLSEEAETRLEQSFLKDPTVAALKEISKIQHDHGVLLGRSVIELKKISSPAVRTYLYRQDGDVFVFQTQINGVPKDESLASLLHDFLSEATDQSEIQKLSEFLSFMASQLPQLYAGLQATRRVELP